MVAGLAADTLVRGMVEDHVHLRVPARLKGERIANDFADFLDVGNAFRLFLVIGGKSGETQQTGHGEGQEFLLHGYNSGC